LHFDLAFTTVEGPPGPWKLKNQSLSCAEHQTVRKVRLFVSPEWPSRLGPAWSPVFWRTSSRVSAKAACKARPLSAHGHWQSTTRVGRQLVRQSTGHAAMTFKLAKAASNASSTWDGHGLRVLGSSLMGITTALPVRCLRPARCPAVAVAWRIFDFMHALLQAATRVRCRQCKWRP
jgi:hypothetical protein